MKRPLGRSGRQLGGNIEMCVGEIGWDCVDLIRLASDVFSNSVSNFFELIAICIDISDILYADSFAHRAGALPCNKRIEN